jgi:hypothetical protein
MSRPTHNDTNYIAANRKGIIDFVGAPVNTIYPADDMYMQAGYAPIGPGQPVYTMAGYPTGLAPGLAPPAGYVQAPFPVQPQPPMPNFPIAYTNSPYYTYAVGPTATTDLAARGVSAKPPVTEETLQQKVDAKIESIMSAHKADMLSQQISRLTDKVQKLSNNIEYKQSGVPSSTISASESGETEMTRRLRKLAAESSRRAVSDGQSNF